MITFTTTAKASISCNLYIMLVTSYFVKKCRRNYLYQYNHLFLVFFLRNKTSECQVVPLQIYGHFQWKHVARNFHLPRKPPTGVVSNSIQPIPMPEIQLPIFPIPFQQVVLPMLLTLFINLLHWPRKGRTSLGSDCGTMLTISHYTERPWE